MNAALELCDLAADPGRPGQAAASSHDRVRKRELPNVDTAEALKTGSSFTPVTERLLTTTGADAPRLATPARTRQLRNQDSADSKRATE
jgi:hypothetical protein